MDQLNLYYSDIFVGKIVRDPSIENIIRGVIQYQELNKSSTVETHLENFIQEVIEMTSEMKKCIDNKIKLGEKIEFDKSEKAKEEFDQKWAPFKKFTDQSNWHVRNTKNETFSISSPMFEASNKFICCFKKTTGQTGKH